jgi:ribonuclease HI
MAFPTLPPVTPLVLRFDGACAPNPGPMGVGYTISQGLSRILVRAGAQVGHGTNNLAEYNALIYGLRHALRLGMWELAVLSDSLLVVNQVKGIWKVRDKGLRRHQEEAVALLDLFRDVTIEHVRREQNQEADALSHQLVMEEPTMPPPLMWGKVRRLLHPWQAAAIRFWWLGGETNTYRLGRIFNIAPNVVQQIADEGSYRNADFTGLPDWSSYEAVAV